VPSVKEPVKESPSLIDASLGSVKRAVSS